MKHLLFNLLFCLGTLTLSAQNPQVADTVVVYDTVKLYLPAPKPATRSEETPQVKAADSAVRTSQTDASTASPQSTTRPRSAAARSRAQAKTDPTAVQTTEPVLSDTSSEDSNASPNTPMTDGSEGLALDEQANSSLITINKDLKWFPVYLSLCYPAGVHGMRSRDYRYVFGFSPLSVVAGSIHGVSVSGIYSQIAHDYFGIQVSGIAAVNRGPMIGVQVSGIHGQTSGMNGVQVNGISSFSKGPLRGVQVAGIVAKADTVNGIQVGGIINVNRGYLRGLQVGGMINRSAGETYGFQVAGFGNSSGKAFVGLQVAGLTNFVRGNISGIQVSGITNAAKGDLNGLQVSTVVNKARDVNGMQVGVVNVARKLRGFQLGLLNICDSADGVSLGLMTIVRKQFYGEIEVAWANYLHAGLQYNMGAKHFHTSYVIGMHQPKSSPTYIVHGIGLGSLFRLYKGLHLHPQIMSYLYYAPKTLIGYAWDDWGSLDTHDPFVSSTHLKIGVAYYFWDRLGIKITPSVYFTDNYNDYVYHLGDQSLAEPQVQGLARIERAATSFGRDFGIGFGLQVGITFKF